MEPNGAGNRGSARGERGEQDGHVAWPLVMGHMAAAQPVRIGPQARPCCRKGQAEQWWVISIFCYFLSFSAFYRNVGPGRAFSPNCPAPGQPRTSPQTPVSPCLLRAHRLQVWYL